MTLEQERQIEKIFKDFVKARYDHVRKLSLESLQINPPFLRQLGEQLQWRGVRNHLMADQANLSVRRKDGKANL